MLGAYSGIQCIPFTEFFFYRSAIRLVDSHDFHITCSIWLCMCRYIYKLYFLNDRPELIKLLKPLILSD